MMDKATITLIHNRRRDGKGTLEFRIFFPLEKKYYYVLTGVNMTEKKYDRIRHVALSKINSKDKVVLGIKEQQKSLIMLINALEKEGDVSVERFKKELVGNKREKDFITFCEKAIKADTKISEATRKNYLQVVDVLKKYKEEIPFDSINLSFYTGLGLFMKNELELSESTMKKDWIVIMKYIRLAEALGCVKRT